jgi:hypothetical protein
MHEADNYISAVMQRAWPQTEDEARRNIKGPMNAFLKKTRNPAVGIKGKVLERLDNQRSRFAFMAE